MRRLSELTLTILLITVCFNFSVTAEWKRGGGEGKKTSRYTVIFTLAKIRIVTGTTMEHA